MELHNVESVIPLEGEGIRLCRVPEPVRRALHSDARDAGVYHTCGCEIRFVLEGEMARIKLRQGKGNLHDEAGLASDQMPGEAQDREPGCVSEQTWSQVEVYFGAFQGAAPWVTVHLCEGEVEVIVRPPGHLEMLQRLAATGSLAFDPAVVRILLPHRGMWEIISVEGELHPPEPGQLPRQRWLAYGSSAAHGSGYPRPTGTYPMRTAQRLGMDLLHLGFTGSAHMEDAMALYIASRSDWHMASVELGSGVLEAWEEDRLERQVNRFLTLLTIGLRDRRLICTDLFQCRYDLQGEGKAARLRCMVRSAVESLGHPGVVYVPGTELLGDPSLLSADLLLPSAYGHEVISARLCEIALR
ncbi:MULTISPECIES: SGNH/GDSL hydrolase family protein [Paenibacillus]|uniref:SGNH/GDSL hydrolase family protein n=1 Tax=Paenibacillus TaxID=44249 RepID=UPI0022B9183F|nr:SGNH/GDSL hydrolase family protein [Paenibacillus caseinilyticus]MCZ8518934.1 hypothetical protein [Paenibacillus caseinilyticus]